MRRYLTPMTCVIMVFSLSAYMVKSQQTLIYLYTPQSQTNYFNLTTTTNLLLDVNGYCRTCPNYLIVHGWQSGTSTWMSGIKDELYKNASQINVFIVNWAWGSDVTSSNLNDMFGYETAIKNMNQTVRDIWSYMGYYVDNQWINQSSAKSQINIHCIGHSLGAHICGLTGNLAKSTTFMKFKRITGLDPAGPCFDTYAVVNRLDKEDAHYVSVIHTSSLLGYDKPLGHTDFYPNGGTQQPGCYPENYSTDLNSKDFAIVSYFVCNRNINFAVDTSSLSKSTMRALPNILSICSHARAYEYFNESINSGPCRFVSGQCRSWFDFQKARCQTCAQNWMGLWSQKFSNQSASYYLNVNYQQPYCVNRAYDVSYNSTGNVYCSHASESVFIKTTGQFLVSTCLLNIVAVVMGSFVL